MKILHIPNYYKPHIGGIEQVAYDIVRSLEGNEQRIFCFNHRKGTERGEEDGVPIVRVGCFAKVASQSLAFGYAKKLRKEFRTFGPDVVVLHYPNPFASHALLKCLKKYPACKLILWWHLDITKQKVLGKFFNGQNHRLLRRADRVIATSPNYIAGSKYLSAYRDKCTVIPNCASSERISYGEEETARAEELKEIFAGRTVLFALGRHVPYKGMEYLVRASKLLPEEYAVCIGGEGPLTASLRELAEDDSKVIFLGRVDEQERKAYLLASDIFCFPSVTKNEAFGIALAEAMAFGKPCVTFTVEGSGVNYVSVAGETGEEVANGDAEAYAEAIEKIASDESLRARYAAAAEQRARALFSEEAFRGNVAGLFEGLGI